MTQSKRASRAVPSWVPVDVRNYVFHTEMGQAIRVLARSQSCHASTIMRQVRKVEQRRDDPLVDRAIRALADETGDADGPSPLALLQALRRMAMPDAMLAFAMGMDQGVIVQGGSTHEPDHGSPLPMDTAMSLALRGWIACKQSASRVLRYRITPAGRVALRELTAQSENTAREMAEGPAGFKGAPNGVGTWGAKTEGGTAVQARHPSQDSPVLALSRRKDIDGKPFISRAMVRAAERLREGYELAQVAKLGIDGPAPNWRAILAAIEAHETTKPHRSEAARQVVEALEFLGPGLSEVALRCCCMLEGLEITEKHMGWAARSGKVVLRIALQRLVLHFETTGDLGPKIG